MARSKSKKQPKQRQQNSRGTLQRRGEERSTSVAFSPVSFVRRFGEEMDRLLNDFGFQGGWLAPVLGREFGDGVWSPEIEMVERDGQLLVRADLPGLTKDDVKVELADHALTIEGERHGEREERGEGYYRSERSYGRFYRKLPVPEGALADKASATFRNGVLEITMPTSKPQDRKVKQLEIGGDTPAKARANAAGG